MPGENNAIKIEYLFWSRVPYIKMYVVFYVTGMVNVSLNALSMQPPHDHGGRIGGLVVERPCLSTKTPGSITVFGACGLQIRGERACVRFLSGKALTQNAQRT